MKSVWNCSSLRNTSGRSRYVTRVLLNTIIPRLNFKLPHPQYNSQTLDYDYMILTLQDFWQWSDYIKPITLVSPTDAELPSNIDCQSSGYGMSQHINGNPGTGSKPWLILTATYHYDRKLSKASIRYHCCHPPMDGYQLHYKS